jgi:hypothetical protein
VSTLVEIMEDKGPPEQARIKAAVSILELADKGTQPRWLIGGSRTPRSGF